MNDENWFSAKLRFVVMVEPVGGTSLNDCVFVFKSKDFKDAFRKSIKIGRKNEQEYLNIYEKKVIWRFMKIISLDIIQSDDLDGAEVHSQFIELNEQDTIPFGTEFDPKKSKPGQTI